MCCCVVPGGLAHLAHLAQRWICIKIGNKKQFLTINYPKNGGFCMKKSQYFKQEQICVRSVG